MEKILSYNIFSVLFKLYSFGKKVEKLNLGPMLYGEYYFIDLEWLKNFKNKFNFTELENIFNDKMSLEDIEKIKKLKDKNIMNRIYDYYLKIKSDHKFNVTENEFDSIKIINNQNTCQIQKEGKNQSFVYKNFALITPKIQKELEDCGFIFQIFPKFDVYIGSKNIIFENNNGDYRNCLQCIIYKDYDDFEEEFIIKYENKNLLDEGKKIIIEEKIEAYFNKNNIEIDGYEEQYIYNINKEKIATVINLNKAKKKECQLSAQNSIAKYSKKINNNININNSDPQNNIKINNNIIQNNINNNKIIILNNNDNNLSNSSNLSNINLSFNNEKDTNFFQNVQIKEVGFKNFGNSCYINAVLECLIHIPELVKYFLKKDDYDNNMPVSLAFKLLLHQIYYPNNFMGNINYNIDECLALFCQVINILNNNFSVSVPNDAKDFLIFLIEKLHRELNKSYVKKEQKMIQPHNLVNPKDPLYNFIQYFSQNYNSKISDLFNWTNQIRRVCSNCKSQILSYQTFPYLILDLEKTRRQIFESDISNYHKSKIKDEIWQNDYYDARENIPINLIDCIKYYGSYVNTFEFFCPLCKTNCQQNTVNRIYMSPYVFIFILNRGKNNIFSVKMNYPPVIDLSKEVESVKSPTVYELTGVITHLGVSGPNGHFIAFCKNIHTQKWFKYNDDKYYEADNFNVHNEGIAYILFYSHKK